MAELKDICTYLDDFLQIKKFRDYCPNGLQVEGRPQVNHIVTGVTACADLIQQAIDQEADAILVHHGYFWKGEEPVLVGMKVRRVRYLLDHGISLLAYHLPLDAHPEVGNNRELARRLQIDPLGVLDEGQAMPIALYGQLKEPLSPAAFAQSIADALQREPLWIDGGPDTIQRVGVCTGAAQDYIEYAVAKQLDAFVSGEVSERTTHIAREEGIHYYAAGHHATERYGVQALAEKLVQQFSLRHTYIEVPNPV